MKRKALDQEKRKLEFVRNVKEIDEDFERAGFMFLALELDETPRPNSGGPAKPRLPESGPRNTGKR